MMEPLVERAQRAFSGDRAHSHVIAISGFHRIQASPGYRAAADYIAGELAAEGLEVVIRSYPADGAARFWSTPSFLEWDCETAGLHLLGDDPRPVETLCDFAAIPTSLIQRSIAADGNYEVVVLPGKGGSHPDDYAGVDVRGKLILTDRPIAQVQQLAVRERGAAGILFDGMGMSGRTPLDLPDARQYTSFWWAGKTQPDGWGFVLSPRQGRRLRDRLTAGQTVRVRAQIEARFYAGAYEVVEAWIPGNHPEREEVLLVSHLCHPKPGAHDNASGATTLLEAAVALKRMQRDDPAASLRRGIRCIWIPEMTGTYAWLAAHEADLARGRWVAGLNLDMVGADQCQTGSVWELVDLPLAGAAFADHLLAWLREPLTTGQRHRETGFSGGSDHYILSDPTVGVPTPMLIQWPDRFYHTSADTPDRVSPDSLARSGALTVAYAWWLATAGPAETRWLGDWMVARDATQAGHQALATLETLQRADATQRTQIWLNYHRAADFRATCMVTALSTLTRLEPQEVGRLRALTERVNRTNAEQQALVASEMAFDGELEAPGPGEAATLIPRRLARGPIDTAMCLQASAPERLPELWALNETLHYDVTSLLQYWADGRRSVAEVADCVALETGKPCDPAKALAYFHLLEATSYLTLEPSAYE